MFWLSQTCFFLLLLHSVASEVFLNSDDASQILNRRRRANSPFEEWRQGDMERECIEEPCDREEAREIFEDDKLTTEFWNKYYDGDACESKPCVHNGVCKDGIGTYTCFCLAGFQGYSCEIDIAEMCENNNGDCDHFCHVKKDSVQCSCADGYYLDTDDKSCLSNDGDQCKPNPCLHGGSCKDSVGGYTCSCTELYHGKNCEIDNSQCPTKGPFSCDHFCSPKFGAYQCSCTTGYKIHSDKRSCIPAVKHPCGRLQPTNQINIAYHVCPHNRCPWQVVFVDEAGAELCSGVILGPHAVLTSASCLYMGKKLHSMQTGASNNSVRIPLSTQLYIHNRHKRGSLEDDLALVRLNEPLPFGPSVSHLCLPTKDFCENVLMSPGREGVARGPDKLRGESHGHPVLSYLHVEGCRNQVNFSQLLSNKMFCMGRQKGFCRTELTRFNETDLKPGLTRNRSLLSGTPVVTVERHTAFLTGLLLSPPTSHDCGQTLVFTKLSRYLHWIQQHLDMTEVRMTPQITQDPPGPYGVTPT